MCTSIVELVVLQRLTGVTPMVTCLPVGWLLTIAGDRIAVFLDVGVVKLALFRGILCFTINLQGQEIEGTHLHDHSPGVPPS